MFNLSIKINNSFKILLGTVFIFIFTVNIDASKTKNLLKDYSKNPQTIEFINMMVEKYNYKRVYLNNLFSNVNKQTIPFNIISGTRTKSTRTKSTKKYPLHGAWDRYVKYKVTEKRISQGIKFRNKYKSTFEKVEKQYGIPAEYITAIIGIESVYGKNVGKFPVFDTLTTLSFEKNRRNNFFKKELKEFIRLASRHKINPKNVMGSYTGAIGLGQFMPSNYEAYGIDFNKDGKISLQHPQDAIASIANYLKENGWKKDEKVATRVSYKGERFRQYKTGYNRKYNRADLMGIKPKYGRWNYKDKVRLIKLSKSSYDELWYAARNFYVITRYNHSAYYAMSVHQLAQALKVSF
ncbi:MAG: lytic murein transglycosylase B [Arcobacteraceae bacterium]|nr:lytic murein transglycosylase B [Arcobacteraceae bacterium]